MKKNLLMDFGKNVRLNVYHNGTERYLPDTVSIRDFREKTEGQIKQELIHHLIKVDAWSGWYTFYLYETKTIVYSFYYVKKDSKFNF